MIDSYDVLVNHLKFRLLWFGVLPSKQTYKSQNIWGYT